MPTNYDIEVVRGDDRKFTVVYKDRGNITGATIKYTVKDRVGGTQQFQRTVGTGITITDGPNGVFDVELVPANTSGMTAGEFVHDIEVTLGGKVDTVILGLFILVGDVS